MKTLLLFVVLLSALSPRCPAADPPWVRWPADAKEDFDASIQVPAAFKVIAPRVRQLDRTIINGRFRSADGAVEFAVAADYVRRLEPSVQARAIPLSLLPGERIRERTPTKRAVKSSDGDYHLYEEGIVVDGPKHAYTRYLRLELSTSSLPGASSCLWEFRVTDEGARKAYAAIYQRFKDTLNLGED